MLQAVEDVRAQALGLLRIGDDYDPGVCPFRVTLGPPPTPVPRVVTISPWPGRHLSDCIFEANMPLASEEGLVPGFYSTLWYLDAVWHWGDWGTGTTPYRSYSQCREDLWLALHYFGALRNGTFVEIGAGNGIAGSNTKFFQDTLHWSGLLIDAQKDNAASAARYRKGAVVRHTAICAEENGSVEFVDASVRGDFKGVVLQLLAQALGADLLAKQKGASSRGVFGDFDAGTPGRKVPCGPIGGMIREAGMKRIDVFSLDAEGAEYTILQTFDWSIPVCIWLVEWGNSAANQMLLDHGYQRMEYTPHGQCLGPCLITNLLFWNPNLEGCPAYAPQR
eukprot:CAMPEP_0117472810 /NCGR_PEP_ID=MMETSP0784-20121206/8443_1 /TAXON_ID=39447 /ORGANISM="" /LENGTH=334 /DNA_ID=CAMNT_0005266981 /DNA_START=171 /DNA_END=1176 /DNA_ORIENTATION=-